MCVYVHTAEWKGMCVSECVSVAGLHYIVKCISYWAHGFKGLKTTTVLNASKEYSGALGRESD